ncbi:RNA binding protein [Artemisia annua]|uniref:RNA binding protein n=1 Tax=Artemisia annua TaxID=35608 RepID=A0A2U1KB80_ARTAN|nr:RNA binding protein [Artemisia annua]
MVVKAKVVIVDSFGAIVQFASGVKALCPLHHMSELEIVKPRKKFQVGAELVFRVRGCKSKRITVTHKKTLVKSKLPVLSSFTDATEGLWTHGWIVKIENHGCFIRFYNGVQGYAPRSELGLDPGSEVSSMYHVEQVVKCRVTSSVPATRRIILSFLVTPTRTSEDEDVKLGSLVSGTVEKVTEKFISVDVGVKGYIRGIIYSEHLADNHVFRVRGCKSKRITVTHKKTLVKSKLPVLSSFTDATEGLWTHGWIVKIENHGCFIRFYNGVQGYAPRSELGLDPGSEVSSMYHVEQVVKCRVTSSVPATRRIILSFLVTPTRTSEDEDVKLGSLVSGTVEKVTEKFISVDVGVKGYIRGIIYSEHLADNHVLACTMMELLKPGYKFEKLLILGFITHHQLGGSTVDIGSTVKATILDVVKKDRLVDLSLKPELVNRYTENNDSRTPKKMRKRSAQKDLDVHQTVNAVVEIVKENYLVLSIPDAKFVLGYASLSDYNTQNCPPKQFVGGQRVIVTVMALPDASTADRLLLLLKSNNEVVESSSAKRAKKKSSNDVGSSVQAEVTEIKPLELKLKFGSGLHGRIHITETKLVCALQKNSIIQFVNV